MLHRDEEGLFAKKKEIEELLGKSMGSRKVLDEATKSSVLVHKCSDI
jgi:hypothetical protein